MSPKPSIDNLKKFTGQSFQLNPKLQSVLGNLDVQLEDELARYRRQKRAEAQAPQPSARRITPLGNQKNLDLVVTPTPRELSATKSVEPFPAEVESKSDVEFIESETSATPQTRPQKLEATFSPPSESSLAPIRNHPDTAQPNEYLESSEQLLGSLDDSKINQLPKSRRRRRRSFKEILSPLTVGVTLLFVLAIGTLAHVLIGKQGGQPITTAENSDSSPTETPLPEVPRSPNLADKEFVPLDLDTLGTLSGNRPTPTPTPTPPTPELTGQVPNSATAPATPNQNYPSLENLNTAILPQSVQENRQNANSSDSNSTDSNSTDSNSTAPNNSDAANNSPAASTAAKPEQPPTNSEPPTTPDQPTQPTVSPQSFPAFFYVLIGYNNDDSLFIARQVVPDAYVREFPIGVRIQMGAFEDAASAQTLVNYLKEQGMAAQVYQP